MIENQTDTRNETLRHVAALMMNAARTAPKARGIDNLEIAMLTGDAIERLASKLKEMRRNRAGLSLPAMRKTSSSPAPLSWSAADTASWD